MVSETAEPEPVTPAEHQPEAPTGILPSAEGSEGPSTGFVIDDELKAALKATGAFTPPQIKALTDAEDELPNWSKNRYAELKGFAGPTAYIAHDIISRHIGQQALSQTASGPMPDHPPYLDDPDEYDPHNPSQVYTHVDGRLFRWDGKRGKQDLESFEWGKLRPVMVVKHIDVDGVMVPDADSAKAAIVAGADWFHHGYKCWIGNGAKPLAAIDPRMSERVRLAQERTSGAQIAQRSLAALS